MAAVGPGRFDGDRARKNAPLVTRFRRFGRYRLRGRCRVRLAPQQFERPLLQRRQRAQLRHTVLRSRLQPQLQRRERRQVCQQVREALQRLSRAVLALALLRPHRRAHRPRLPFLPVLVQEQQRRQPLPHVPFQVVRQHADQQVRPHPPLLPVEHRPHRQQRLQRPEGPLHPRQALVRPHRLGVPQLLLLQARADHVDPVQTLLRPDRLLLPPGAERLRLLVERPLEVLAQAPPSQPAQAPVELVAVVAACRVPGRQLLRIRRGQLQQHVALAPPLGRHQRVVADQQPLAGVLLAGHAGQARGVEQPGLDHVALHQLAEGVPAQAGVPGETFRRAWLLGCVRKSMTLINHPATQPIRSLRYCVPLLQEVQLEPVPNSYWQHLEFNLERCEDYWSLKQDTLPDRAYPFLEQANTASPDVSSPQPTTKGTLNR